MQTRKWSVEFFEDDYSVHSVIEAENLGGVEAALNAKGVATENIIRVQRNFLTTQEGTSKVSMLEGVGGGN